MQLFKSLTAIIRLILFAIITSLVLIPIVLGKFFFKSDQKYLVYGMKLRRFIIRSLHFVLNTKIITYGSEPKENGLIISNHRSYFDSLVILKNILGFPIAKKELENWPLVGQVCKSTGLLFVERESKASRNNTRIQLKEVLKNGNSILNTPEGTTHIEPTTIDFKPGAFVMAAELQVPVIPIAIDYKNITDAWIGNDTFLPHFLKCFGKWETEIKISYLQPIISSDPEFLITESKKAIDQELLRFRKDWNT